jgi:glutamate carboxypeptidase
MTANRAAVPGPDPTQGCVPLLHELCAVSSASGDLVGLASLADRLASELAACGLHTEVRSEANGRGGVEPVLVAGAVDAARDVLLLVGHLDTVLPAATPRREGAWLHGTGALDMKGGLAALVCALRVLRARGVPPPAGLVFVGVPDEEASGEVGGRVVRAWGSRARAMLVLEPGEARAEGETIVAGRRGLTEWRLEVRGTAAHSGLAYWDGRSALAAAAEWCARAQRLSRRGPGATVNVARLVAGDADFVLALAEHHELLGTSRRRNVIPDHAVAEGEVRFLSVRDRDATLRRLRALASRIAGVHGVSAEIALGSTVPPVSPGGAGAPLVRRAVELAEARGWKLVVEEDRGGISFPNYLEDPARLPILDGLGPVGEGMHTRDERLDLRSLERRVVLLADLLATL